MIILKPIIDTDKEYGLVLEGGGAKGAYQIGAWKALIEAGIKINAAAGTSVGALNGALICMNDIKAAKQTWEDLTFSRVMNVSDEWMESFFKNELPLKEVMSYLFEQLKSGGVDVSPLRELIHEIVDEKKVRDSDMDFYILTFSVSEFKELDLNIDDIPEGLLEDFLLASCYLLGFKREKLHGMTYIDGGVINNLPIDTLVNRGYKDIIEIRIFGPGREPKVKMPKDGVRLTIAPRINLGSILEFSPKRSRLNMKVGYYDAKRMIYGLAGYIYYIYQPYPNEHFEEILSALTEREKKEIRSVLRLSRASNDFEIYIGLLEATAKILHIKKYQVYTIDEFYNIIIERLKGISKEEAEEFPIFVNTLLELE